MSERTPEEKLLWDIFAAPESRLPHDHPEFVEGCFRCDLSHDETAGADS